MDKPVTSVSHGQQFFLTVSLPFWAVSCHYLEAFSHQAAQFFLFTSITQLEARYHLHCLGNMAQAFQRQGSQFCSDSLTEAGYWKARLVPSELPGENFLH